MTQLLLRPVLLSVDTTWFISWSCNKLNGSFHPVLPDIFLMVLLILMSLRHIAQIALSPVQADVFVITRSFELCSWRSLLQVLSNGDLLIRNIQWIEHMGLYRCEAENAEGKDEVSTFLYPVSNRVNICGVYPITELLLDVGTLYFFILLPKIFFLFKFGVQEVHETYRISRIECQRLFYGIMESNIGTK